MCLIFTCNYNFSGYENQEYNFGFMQSINETRKELGLVAAKLRVTSVKTFKSETKSHIDTSHNILDFKVHKFCLQIEKRFLIENKKEDFHH